MGGGMGVGLGRILTMKIVTKMRAQTQHWCHGPQSSLQPVS